MFFNIYVLNDNETVLRPIKRSTAQLTLTLTPPPDSKHNLNHILNLIFIFPAQGGFLGWQADTDGFACCRWSRPKESSELRALWRTLQTLSASRPRRSSYATCRLCVTSSHSVTSSWRHRTCRLWRRSRPRRIRRSSFRFPSSCCPASHRRRRIHSILLLEPNLHLT